MRPYSNYTQAGLDYISTLRTGGAEDRCLQSNYLRRIKRILKKKRKNVPGGLIKWSDPCVIS